MFSRIKKFLKHLDIALLKEELRKIGVNLITGGVVGIFINHFVGSNLTVLLWSAILIAFWGLICLVIGSYRKSQYE